MPSIRVAWHLPPACLNSSILPIQLGDCIFVQSQLAYTVSIDRAANHHTRFDWSLTVGCLGKPEHVQWPYIIYDLDLEHNLHQTLFPLLQFIRYSSLHLSLSFYISSFSTCIIQNPLISQHLDLLSSEAFSLFL